MCVVPPAREIFPHGPSEIVVFDFDERICNAVERFADKERLGTLRSCLYNVLDAFPECGEFDCFYTNPPWGASNDGESVKVFMQRGMEATAYRGAGMVVVADDPGLDWTKRVLARLQGAALDAGFFVQRMPTHVHSYHLDDNPDLRSCNVIVNAVDDDARSVASEEIRDADRLAHFYGRNLVPRVRYVREKPRLDYGMAHDTDYEFDLLEEPR